MDWLNLAWQCLSIFGRAGGGSSTSSSSSSSSNGGSYGGNYGGDSSVGGAKSILVSLTVLAVGVATAFVYEKLQKSKGLAKKARPLAATFGAVRVISLSYYLWYN